MSNETPRTGMTPLWVISLFVSLTEVVTGIAVTKAIGGMQIALTIFVISFPLMVAAAFFAILWNRPYVFYPPTEFKSGINVDEYVAAMRRRTIDDSILLKIIKDTIENSIQSPMLFTKLKSKISKEDSSEYILKEFTELMSRNAEDGFENQVITIDVSMLTGKEKQLLYRPFNEKQSISEFLDGIYYDLSAYIEPSTYGKDWILQDLYTRKLFGNMGRLWAKQHGKFKDLRLINDVGIKAGIKLIAQRCKRKDLLID